MIKQEQLSALEDVGEQGGPGGAEDDRVSRSIPMVGAQLDSRDLFSGGRLITIAHGKQIYQLRLTAQNKLILTK
ncbi:MAG: hemin uptake protein HemP [Xanthobacter sp.]